MNVLANKPYDRARLDLVAGAAVGGLPILDVGSVPSVAAYLAGQKKEIVSLDLDAIASAGGLFGGAVAYGTISALSEPELRAVVESVGSRLAIGAPLMFSLTGRDREDVAQVLESIALFDAIRVEARRPYAFEPQMTQVFATARRR